MRIQMRKASLPIHPPARTKVILTSQLKSHPRIKTKQSKHQKPHLRKLPKLYLPKIALAENIKLVTNTFVTLLGGRDEMPRRSQYAFLRRYQESVMFLYSLFFQMPIKHSVQSINFGYDYRNLPSGNFQQSIYYGSIIC